MGPRAGLNDMERRTFLTLLLVLELRPLSPPGSFKLVRSGYLRFFPQGIEQVETDHLPLLGAEFETAWSCTSIYFTMTDLFVISP